MTQWNDRKVIRYKLMTLNSKGPSATEIRTKFQKLENEENISY